MTEIVSGLWIGDRESALSIQWLKQHKISVVINCTRSVEFADYPGLKHVLRVPVNDNLERTEVEKMSKYLIPVSDKIAQWLPDHNILVHCYAGRQRSSTIILAYLMRYGEIPLDEAIRLIRTKKETACMPKCNFYNALLTHNL
jgi:dual specificity phosphatase 12